MMKTLFILACFVLNTACYANTISRLVAKNYQDRLYTLPIYKQEHFAARMYLLMEDERYINPIIVYSHFLSLRYRVALSKLNDAALIANEGRELLSVTERDTAKRKRYNKRIAKFGSMGFYINLLVILNKVYSYHLEGTPLFPDTLLAIDAIKAQRAQFEHFILDKENIRIYGAQLINYVFYLYDLGVLDLRSNYTSNFKQYFSDNQDRTLSTVDYESKIYGMTHFITAASRYYKNPVEYKEYSWIIDYFENNVDQIIARTENDVIAEVGVCLLLVNKKNTPAAQKIKSYISTTYDAHYKLVKNKANDVDFTYGEHRNILAIMLLSLPQKAFGNPIIHQRLNALLLQGINSTLKVNL